MMGCNDVREKFSPYLEGNASAEEKKTIEEHCLSCKLCRSILEDLRKAKELVRNLEEVEPPPWLTKKIMAKVLVEGERKHGIIQKLFFPLHIKIPIEALATVFLAIMTVYVFRSVQPELKSLSMHPGVEPSIPKIEAKKQPPQPEAVALSPEKKAVPQGLGRKGVIPRGEGEKSIVPRLEDRELAGEEKEAPPSSEMQKMVPAEPPMVPEERETTAGKFEMAQGPAESSEPQELILSQPAPVPATKQEDRLAAGPAVRDMEKRKALSAAPSLLKDLSTSKGEPIGFTVKVQDLNAASKEVETFLTQIGAVRNEKESHEDRTIITFVMKSEKIGELIEKLNRTGEVQGKGVPSTTPGGDVSIRIEIVSIR